MYKAGISKKELVLSGGVIRGRIKTAGFHEYEWDVDEVERRIGSWVNGFGKKPKKYDLDIDFCGTKYERAKAMNDFYEITEADILAVKPGRLFLDDYYINCFIIGSEPEKVDNQYRKVQKRVSVYAHYPFWINRKEYEFLKGRATETAGEFLDYEFDYEYDYLGSINGIGKIENTGLSPCNFEAIIYGPCINPRFVITNHVYEVKTKVESEEYVLIKSVEGTVERIRKNGSVVNEFNNRNKSSSIFEKIPVGSNLISWDGTFGIDISLLIERSEPECR